MIKLVLAVFVLAVSGGAQAALPKIDPALKRFFVQTEVMQQQGPAKVIALFHDKQVFQKMEHAPSSHGQMEMVLRENARASQQATFNRLKGLSEAGMPVKAESLWILNAAVFTLPAEALKDLARDENVISIYDANRIVKLPQDYESPITEQQGKFTYGLSKINVPQLREKAPTIDGRGVKVGILDTGIDANHPDLKGRVIAFKDFIGNKAEPYDDNAHGTHVAGTIAGGNASGTYIGVAPGAKLIVGKVFSSGGSATLEGLLKAMQWIADPDGNPSTNDQPALVSNSWGGGMTNGNKDPIDEPFCKALKGWVKVGILPVFAAGNSGPGSSSVNLPGACPDALTIGATDENDHIAPFSSRGPARWKSGQVIKPTVSAPGVKVISSVPGGGYKAFSGTSMATPHTAGLAALVVQSVPNANIETIQKMIVAGATHLNATDAQDPNNTFGAGRIDAYKTVKSAVNFASERFR